MKVTIHQEEVQVQFCSFVVQFSTPAISEYTVIECSSLPDIENGMITYSTEPYVYRTTATYQCALGYELTGGDDERTCTGDGGSPVGQWNGTAPNCTGIRFLILMYAFPVLQFTAVSCNSPPNIGNGSIVKSTGITFRKTVTYNCNPGFVMFGSPVVECLDTGSWSLLPYCSGTNFDPTTLLLAAI